MEFSKPGKNYLSRCHSGSKPIFGTPIDIIKTMKILIWGLSIPMALMFNTSGQTAESMSAERMLRSLNVTIALIEHRLQTQDQQATPFAYGMQEQQVAVNEETSARLFHEGPFLQLPKDINKAIQPRAPEMIG